MNTIAIPFDQALFIAYADSRKTVELFRIYTTDEASYYQAYDTMIEKYSFWSCKDRRVVDANLSPYERWQLEKKGTVINEAPCDQFENTPPSMEENLNQIFEAVMDDHWGY